MGFPRILSIATLFCLISLFPAPSTAQPFSCIGAAVCNSLIDYTTPNATTLSAVRTLFNVKNLRTLLGANNLPPSTPQTSPVPANQTLKIPFPCICLNGTGVSNHRPVYRVVAGDGLYHIAAEVFSGLVTYPRIQEVNNITDANLIKVGQELWIPLPCSCDEVDGERVVHYGHVVEEGSSVEGIAQEFNTTTDTLLQVNGITNSSQLIAGAVLDVPLRVCTSSIANTSLDYPLLVPNGTYVFTATNCVRCHCDAANNYVLQCEPSGVNSSNWQSCPSMQCQGADNLYLSNSTSSSCNHTTCAYAGYTNQTILTTLARDNTCPGSGDNNSASNYVCCLLIIPLYLFMKTSLKSLSSHIPTNWPVFGMIPALICNSHRVHDFATDVLKEVGGTFLLKGPWFANMDMLITSDPANIHHILSKNFPNYPKGPEFRKIFDILGDGIFNSDSELWEMHRKTTMSFFTHAKFHSLLERTVWSTVEQGLIPVLEFVSKQGIEVDLQEIFQRFTFDGICKLVLDYDPKSLSIDLPYIPCEKGFTNIEEALLYRHIFPEKLWKLQSWLQIGKEKKLSQAWKAFDQFVYKCISLKQDELDVSCRNGGGTTLTDDLDLLGAYMRAYKDIKGTSGDPKQFLRDTLLSLMIAGRDTTSTALTWFFFLLGKNSLVESKIREEIQTGLGEKLRTNNFGAEELRSQLVYLHGALCESLRLYPPVALEHKAPSKPDILPSGHHVNQKTKIILSSYSMGRMESIWGNDCMEFKPERWISERGGIKHVPSYKFPAFHAGPRTCLGKEMAFIQMKIVATSIIWNYHVEVVDGHPVSPSDSIILQLKHGLKMRLTKCCTDP